MSANTLATPGTPVLLALDDEQDVVDLVCAVGTRAGFQTVGTITCDAFKRALELHRPAIVVLDLQMPDMDGIEMLRFLGDEKVDAGIVLVTGVDQRTISSAEQFGLSRGLRLLGSLQKPFLPEDLVERLHAAQPQASGPTAADLQRALERDELVVHYQPTIKRFADGSWDVASVEALLRWNHATRGILAPDAFLEMGEAHGLMGAMTDFVIQRGIEQLRGWKARRFKLGLRINIAASLICDIDFPDRLETILLEQEIDPEALTLEITETATLEQGPDTTDILTRLRLKNIHLAIDDFGIGYSSLTQLVRMPFSEMKIDKSLLAGLSELKESKVMVEALIDLAHKLNLTVCAEGVETEEVLAFLSGAGCDAAQGYYISRPVAASEIPTVIEQWERHQRRSLERSAG